MASEIPAPSSTGYQPARGEGYTHIDIEVRPSIGFQTVGLTARLQFATPRSFSDVLPAYEDARAQLEELALEAIKPLIDAREQEEQARKGRPATPVTSTPALAPQPPAPTQSAGPSSPSELPWRLANKPKNNGSFRYLPTSHLTSEQLYVQTKDELQNLGINPDDIVVFDNRVGKYGLEDGHESYSAGIVKVRDEAPFAAALNGKTIVANVDFNYSDGTLRVALTKDAKVAIQGLALAKQLAATETPF
jgi:hypothetical protein